MPAPKKHQFRAGCLFPCSRNMWSIIYGRCRSSLACLAGKYEAKARQGLSTNAEATQKSQNLSQAEGRRAPVLVARWHTTRDVDIDSSIPRVKSETSTRGVHTFWAFAYFQKKVCSVSQHCSGTTGLNAYFAYFAYFFS